MPNDHKAFLAADVLYFKKAPRAHADIDQTRTHARREQKSQGRFCTIHERQRKKRPIGVLDQDPAICCGCLSPE